MVVVHVEVFIQRRDVLLPPGLGLGLGLGLGVMEASFLYDPVDGILRHLPIRGPFPPCNESDSCLWVHANDVVP